MSRLAAVLALGLCACGGTATPGPTTPTEPRDPRRYFPLEAGLVWSYEVDTGEAERTLGTVRVLRVDATGAQVATNGGDSVTYVADAEGIRRLGEGGFVLRAPLEVGARFPTEGGRTAVIEAVDARVRTGMGELTDCLRVVTEGELGNSIATIYCPDVGPASIVTSLTSDTGAGTIRLEATLIGLVRSPVQEP